MNKIKCSNCYKSRNHTERTSATTHKAWDTLCPFYVKEKEMLMSRTMGCTQQAKTPTVKGYRNYEQNWEDDNWNL